MGASCSTGQDATKATAPEKKDGVAAPAVKGGLPKDSIIVFVLGGPGCGKGTQCDKIKAKYAGVVHLSAGDLLRAEVKSGSAVGQECEALMKEGKLVPMSVTIKLLKNAMVQSGGKFFLVDGFPRALDQAEAFEKDVMKCKTVLFFDCPEEEMKKRLLHRGETSGRSDDNEETIMKRFHTFQTESLPVKEHFGQQGKCHVISAVPHPDQVFIEVCKVLDPLAPKDAPKSKDAKPKEEKKKEEKKDKKKKEEEEEEEEEKEEKDKDDKDKDDKKDKKKDKDDKEEEAEESREEAYEEAAEAKARYAVDEDQEGGGDDGAAGGDDDGGAGGGGDDDNDRKSDN